ncbi:MAG: NfeD family protein [Clostridiales bacterium]|nr:NfeD family protein [Roseburia sp.]MDD7636428.1 NfeD family protein [Clostridiales bacterium]
MMAIVWIGLIILFAAVEIATVGLTSIWFAGGALAALLCYALGLSEIWQFAIFVIVSLVLLIFTRPWALKYFKPYLVKTNYEQALDENVCLTEAVDNLRGTGTAVYKGQEWTARAYHENETFEAGTIVKVKEIRGVTMYVVKSDIMPSKEVE